MVIELNIAGYLFYFFNFFYIGYAVHSVVVTHYLSFYQYFFFNLAVKK